MRIGFSARRRRITWIVLGAVLGAVLLGIASCAVIVGLALNAASDAVDPANNERTGLLDGSYVLKSNASVIINDQCAFTGEAFDARTEEQVSSSVTVVGSGLDCAYGSNTSLVSFDVESGIATIAQVR